MDFILWSGLKSNQVLVGDSHKFYTTIALACLAAWTQVYIKEIVARLVFTFFFW